MADYLSSEFKLLAACSIWPPSIKRLARIRAAAAEAIDWTVFSTLVPRHQVAGLVHEGLTSAEIRLPSPVASQIKNQACDLSLHSLVLAAEALRLQGLFAAAGVPVLLLKGPPLANLAYGNLGIRQSQDLDLLTDPDSLPEACAAMKRAGYRRVDPPEGISNAQLRTILPVRKDFAYFHRGKTLQVELHWRLLSNSHLMTDAALMKSSREIALSNGAALRTLGPDDLFTYLCAHGAVHWWYQLKWLADIGALLANQSHASVERLYQTAEARGAGRAAAQAMLLCARVLGTDLPSPLISAFRKKGVLRWLEATALDAITSPKKPSERLFGTTRGSLSCFLLGQGLRYQAAELRIHLLCQEDVMTVPLPRRLQFLYPALRLPLWIWRQMRWRPG